MIFKNKLFFIGLILIFILSYLFITSSFFANNLNIYASRIFAIKSCIQDGQIPCRWLSDFKGVSYPLFNYHAPLPYYLGSLISSVNALFIFSLIGGYILMFNLTPFAIFYPLLVLFIQALFPQDGLGISFAFMFLPLTFLRLKALVKVNSIQNFLMLAASVTLLILSTDFYPLLLTAIMLFLIYQYGRTKNSLFVFFSLLSAIFAFSLASFYILPSILERNLIHNTSYNNPLYLLPKSVREAPQEGNKEPYQILTGDSDILNFQKGTNWFKFETNTRYHTIIRISQFYFPQWRILVDGKETNVEYANNSLGLMTIILGEGNHKVEGRLYDTPIRSISNYLTVATAALMLFLFISQLSKMREWIRYYRKRIN